MAKADFDRFVERQPQLSPEGDANSPVILDEWLASLADLYKEIEKYLAECKREGKVTTRYSFIRINEEFLGAYEATQRVMSIGRQEILLVPIARLVIGAQGRVDIEGSAGRSRLLRIPQSVKTRFGGIRVMRQGEKPLPDGAPDGAPIVWKFATLPPRLELFPLSKDAFLSALVEVSNG